MSMYLTIIYILTLPQERCRSIFFEIGYLHIYIIVVWTNISVPSKNKNHIQFLTKNILFTHFLLMQLYRLMNYICILILALYIYPNSNIYYYHTLSSSQ